MTGRRIKCFALSKLDKRSQQIASRRRGTAPKLYGSEFEVPNNTSILSRIFGVKLSKFLNIAVRSGRFYV